MILNRPDWILNHAARQRFSTASIAGAGSGLLQPGELGRSSDSDGRTQRADFQIDPERRRRSAGAGRAAIRVRFGLTGAGTDLDRSRLPPLVCSGMAAGKPATHGAMASAVTSAVTSTVPPPAPPIPRPCRGRPPFAAPPRPHVRPVSTIAAAVSGSAAARRKAVRVLRGRARPDEPSHYPEPRSEA